MVPEQEGLSDDPFSLRQVTRPSWDRCPPWTQRTGVPVSPRQSDMEQDPSVSPRTALPAHSFTYRVPHDGPPRIKSSIKSWGLSPWVFTSLCSHVLCSSYWRYLCAFLLLTCLCRFNCRTQSGTLGGLRNKVLLSYRRKERRREWGKWGRSLLYLNSPDQTKGSIGTDCGTFAISYVILAKSLDCFWLAPMHCWYDSRYWHYSLSAYCPSQSFEPIFGRLGFTS